MNLHSLKLYYYYTNINININININTWELFCLSKNTYILNSPHAKLYQ